MDTNYGCAYAEDRESAIHTEHANVASFPVYNDGYTYWDNYSVYRAWSTAWYETFASAYFAIVLIPTISAYLALAQYVKTRFTKRFGNLL